MTKKKAKKPEDLAPHQCSFCDRGFSQEKLLLNHMCAQKRRHYQRDDRHVRSAFQIYKQFLELNYLDRSRHEPVSYEDFAKSQLYEAFVRFARTLSDLNAIDIPALVKWLATSQPRIPLDDWCKPGTYAAFVRWYVEHETPLRAIERNILLMEKWATDNETSFEQFFRQISPSLALLWIRTGRISPWMLLLSDSGQELMVRMSEEQQSMVFEIVDPNKWNRKMLAHAADVRFLREQLQRFGL